MRESKYYGVKILRPSGEWDFYKVPRFFPVADVQKRCPHSTVAVHVAISERISIDGRGPDSLAVQQGPCDAVWSQSHNGFATTFRDVTKADIALVENYGA